MQIKFFLFQNEENVAISFFKRHLFSTKHLDLIHSKTKLSTLSSLMSSEMYWILDLPFNKTLIYVRRDLMFTSLGANKTKSSALVKKVAWRTDRRLTTEKTREIAAPTHIESVVNGAAETQRGAAASSHYDRFFRKSHINKWFSFDEQTFDT